MTLSALLLQRDRAASDEQSLKRLLRYAWCWPRQPGLRARAETLVQAPAAPDAGESLLLSANGHAGSLWRLVPGDAGPHSAELGKGCREQLQRLQQRVGRDLPFVCHLGGFLPWSVEPLHVHQQGLLTGPSFGLTFALATASRMLGLTFPPDRVACAVVNDAGHVEPVEPEGLRAKLQALRDWAPGVTRVLVAEPQASQARTLCAELDAPLEVDGVRDLGHAIELCFGNVVAQLEQRWHDAAECARLLERLFLHLLDGGTPLLHFEGVAQGATLLARAFPEGSEERTQADWIAIVARGHDGAEDPLPLRKHWLDGMRRPLRLRALSHSVGRAAYATDGERHAIIEYARSQLATTPLDDHPDDLRVLGALGRHAAMRGDYDAARGWLTRAVQGWHELSEWTSGAHALCELTRVAGVTRDDTALRQILAGPALSALSSGALEHTSLCYLAFAIGRAWAQLEAWTLALAWLSDDFAQCPGLDWTRTPAHLQASRARWAWLAAVHVNDDSAAAYGETALYGLAEMPDARFAYCLHRIDKLVFIQDTTTEELDAGALRNELDAFQSIEPRAFALACTLAESSDAVEQARSLGRHYPY